MPQFMTRLRDRRVQSSYPIQLTCQTVGWPELLWYKDGQEIHNDGITFIPNLFVEQRN